jgi:hypothetical protein
VQPYLEVRGREQVWADRNGLSNLDKRGALLGDDVAQRGGALRRVRLHRRVASEEITQRLYVLLVTKFYSVVQVITQVITQVILCPLKCTVYVWSLGGGWFSTAAGLKFLFVFSSTLLTVASPAAMSESSPAPHVTRRATRPLTRVSDASGRARQCVAVLQVECESKGLKPVSHVIGSRVETRRSQAENMRFQAETGRFQAVGLD